MAKADRQTAEIRSADVWLIGEQGEDLGIVPTVEAQRQARERGMELVRLDQLSSPPRYKIALGSAVQMDAARAARIARGASVPPKEIRVRVATGAGDLAARQRSAASLLESGYRVKVRVEMDPGRRSDPLPARSILDGLIKALSASGSVEQKPFNEKGAVAAVLRPLDGSR